MTSPESIRLGVPFHQLDAGNTYLTYARTITEADLTGFLGFSGLRMPLFLDAKWAEKGPFGARIAPGFMTASISAGMLESVLGHQVLAGLSIGEIHFPAPVRIDDTVHLLVEVVDRRVTSNAERGVVTLDVQMRNQLNVPVMQYRSTVLMHVADRTG